MHVYSQPYLRPEVALALATAYLDNARQTNNKELAFEFCSDARNSLSRMKMASKQALVSSRVPSDHELREKVAAAYYQHGLRVDGLGHKDQAQDSYKRADKWRQTNLGRTGSSSSNLRVASKSANSVKAPKVQDVAVLPPGVFEHEVAPAASRYSLPDADESVVNTLQLVYCLSLLPTLTLDTEVLAKTEIEWSQAKASDVEEQERLQKLAVDTLEVFLHGGNNTDASVIEIAYLGPILDDVHFKALLTLLVNAIKQSKSIELHLFHGLALALQHAPPSQINRENIALVLDLLSTRLANIDPDSTEHSFQLVASVSRILDSLVNHSVTGIKREELHEPLLAYIKTLRESQDSFVVYHAAYAFQALQYIPDDESRVKAVLRRPSDLPRGLFAMVNSTRAFDLNVFLDGLWDIQEGLVSQAKMFDIGAGAYSKVSPLTQSGTSLKEYLQESFSFTKKSAWYPALRVADDLIQAGSIEKFKALVCEVACRRDAAFQWGICQRLGGIAATSSWDLHTRQGALVFLCDIYKDEHEWNYHTHIKQLIISILVSLASDTGSSVQVAAASFLEELETDGNTQKQELFYSSRKAQQVHYPLGLTPIPVRSPSLLERVQNKPSLEKSLRQLRKHRLQEPADLIFVPLQAKPSQSSSDSSRFLLLDRVKEFLESEQKVLLILGDSGSGKLAFTRALESELWESYETKTGRIPLRTSLLSIDRPDRDLIPKILRKADFTESQIKELKENRQFVLICDGYAENQQSNNLYAANRFNQAGEWQVQLIISSNIKHLPADYRDRFLPSDQNQQVGSNQFSEVCVAPFSNEQIEEYTKQHITTKDALWQAKDYNAVLSQVPGLQDLVRSPFLLSLALDVLPRLVDLSQDLLSTRISRIQLYDEFVEHWLERSKRHLSGSVRPDDRKTLDSLSEEGFVQHGITFFKDLASAIYLHHGGLHVVEYSSTKDRDTWKTEFFGNDNEKRLLREANPLIQNGHQFRFIHRSVLEYGLVRAAFEPQGGSKDTRNSFEKTTRLNRRGSISSIMSFELEDCTSDELSSTTTTVPLSSILASKSFVGESLIIELLAERALEEPQFKQQLLGSIEQSKSDKRWRTAAINAITILVRAKVSFTAKDLRGIQIPGADLSHGVFDSAQLQGADLRKAKLHHTWLRNADLSDSRMAGVEFGENLQLQEEDGEPRVVRFSPDSKKVLFGLSNGFVAIYDAQTCEIVHALDAHADGILDIDLSPNGKHFATCSIDTNVMVWDVETCELIHTLEGHASSVDRIVYSSTGRHILSLSSKDKEIRQWDALTGELITAFGDGQVKFQGVVFSPDGTHIAAHDVGGSIYVWDAETGQETYKLEGENGVNDIQYSPDGHHLVTAGKDHNVQIRDTRTWATLHVLQGHQNQVEEVVYSPSGNLLATRDQDHQVRLWDTHSAVLLHVIEDCGGSNHRLCFSADDNKLLTSPQDWSVRLWDTRSGQLIRSFVGNEGHVYGVAIAPNGQKIASCSSDGAVRLWDVPSIADISALRDYTTGISSVAVSPESQLVAFASKEAAVRVFDASSGQELHFIPSTHGEIDHIKFSANGERLAASSRNGHLYVWDVTQSSYQQIISVATGNDGKRDRVTVGGRAWDLSSDGSQAAFTTEDHVLRLLELKTGDYTDTAVTRPADVLFTTDGEYVAVVDEHGETQLLDTHLGRVQHRLQDRAEGGNARITLSAEGGLIAIWSSNKVQLWDSRSGKVGPVLTHDEAHTVLCVAFSSDGQYVATGTDSGSVSLWDVSSGEKTYHGLHHRSGVTTLACSPSSHHIISGGQDSTVRLFDGESKGEPMVLEQYHGSVSSLSWSTTAKGDECSSYLVTGDQSGSVRVWRIVHNSFDHHHKVQLLWNTRQMQLDVLGASVTGVHGLDEFNQTLLTQRGTVGAPASAVEPQAIGVNKGAADQKTPGSVKDKANNSQCAVVSAEHVGDNESATVCQVTCGTCETLQLVKIRHVASVV